jgi:hypothetical protein
MSSTGVLVYRTSTAAEVMRRLTWLGRDGAPLDSPGEASRFNGFDLFPDGRRVLVSARDGLQEPDLHTLDVASGRRTRVTFSPEVDTNPLLSPDGRMLLWARWSASREPALYRKATDGSGTEERLGALPHNFTHLTHTTGRWTVATVTGQSGPDIWYLDGGDPRTAKPYQQTDAVEDRGRLSSDGRFMAFNFTDEGPLRVHVRPFPNAEGGLWPVPGSKAGRFPHWRGDGGELYYKTATELMAVDVMVDKGGVVSFGTPHVLFRTPPGVGFQHNFAVTPDGQKFLMAIPDTKAPADTEGAVTPLTVVVNWRSLLSKR